MPGSNAETRVGIKLVTEGGQQVVVDFQQVGAAAKKALAEMQMAPGASSGMLAVDEAGKQLTKTFEDAASSGGGFSSILTKLGPGGLAAAAGLGLLIEGAKRVVEGVAEEEDAVTRLNAVLKATGNQTGQTAGSIKEFALQMQATTKVTSESVMDSAAVLASANVVTGDNFTRTLKVAQDLSTVMKTDLPSATSLLAKALADPEKAAQALRRAHVNLGADTKAMVDEFVRAREPMKAVEAILGDLEKRVGGAGEAEGGTLSGKVVILKDSFKELFTTIGDDTNVGSGLKSFLQWMIDHNAQIVKNLKPDDVSNQIVAANQDLITAQKNLQDATAHPVQAALQGISTTDLQTQVDLAQKRVDDLIAKARQDAAQYDADEKEKVESSARFKEQKEAEDAATRKKALNDIMSGMRDQQALEHETAKLHEQDLAVQKAIAELRVKSPTATQADVDALSAFVRQQVESEQHWKARIELSKQMTALATQEAEAERKAGDEAQKRSDKIIESQHSIGVGYDEQIKQNALLLEAAKVSNENYQVEAKYLEIINKYRADGVPLVGAELDAARKEAEVLVKQQNQLANLSKDDKGYKKDAIQGVKDIGSELENVLLKQEKMSDAFTNIEQQLLKLGTDALVLKPLENAFTGAINGATGSGTDWISSFASKLFGSSGGGGDSSGGALAWLGNLFSGSSGSTGAMSDAFGAGGGMFAGPHASGGDVTPPYYYRINENGDELFRPNVPGSVIPAGGGGGGMQQPPQAPVVHMTIVTPDANSFRRSQSQTVGQLAGSLALNRMRNR